MERTNLCSQGQEPDDEHGADHHACYSAARGGESAHAGTKTLPTGNFTYSTSIAFSVGPCSGEMSS
jgi:hypothetical protein